MDLKIIVVLIILLLVAAVCFETPIVLKHFEEQTIAPTQGTYWQVYSIGEKTFACNTNTCSTKCLEVIINKKY